MMADGESGPLPLEGITVLTLDRVIAGPFAGAILSDLGAKVINVEPPGTGDPYRDGEMPIERAAFNTVHRNRGSIAIDLKSDEGRAVFLDMVADADVVLENFGRGVVENLGVGYEECSRANDDIIYCSIKGFFDGGEYGDRKALDAVAQAMSGLMTMTGEDDAMRAGTSVSDMSTSLFGVIAILAALHQPPGERGQRIETGLFESAVSLMNYWLSYYQIAGEHPEPLGQGHPLWTPYSVFPTSDDKEVFVGVIDDDEWVEMCEAFDFDDLLAAEEYATNKQRVANEDEMNALLGELFSEFERDDIVETLLDLGITTSGVATIDEVVDDSHLDELGLWASVTPDTGGDPIKVPLTPISSDQYKVQNRRDTPELGEDTDTILAEMGYETDRIAKLRADGIVE